MILSTLSVRGFSHVIITDHNGPRSYGELARYSPRAVREWELWLDSLDAANELPDGTLPAVGMSS